MWPMLLDYTKDESKRILRRLELEAYASIISVFRAQGDLCKEKKKILQDLQQTLSISTERHRAEVRRAVNDEKLATIADNIAGTMTTAEWMIEGRRLVPLMPRLVPQTTFTATANQAASAMMEKNASLPPPSQTWNKDGPTATLPKPSRSTSPNSSVVVLPSGTSIHIKEMLNQDDDDELGASVPSRRSSHRSLSSDSQNASSVSTQTPRITYTTASSTMHGSSPVKITISKSPQGRPITVQSSTQPPKVILVTNAGPASGSTVVQRSMSVPVLRTPPTTLSTYSGTGPPRSSALIPGGPSASGPHMVSAFPGVVTSTSSTSLVSATATVQSTTVNSSPAVFSPSVQIGFGKVRPRLVPRQRYPAMLPQQKPGIVIPMGPQLVPPSPNTSTGNQVSQSQQSSAGVQVAPSYHGSGGIQVKTLNKPTIQIKQEGGMKIITQSNTSKILPKPSQLSGGGGTPVVMVNTGQSIAGNNSGVTLLPRSVSSYTAHSGGKVLNITTPGGRVIATTTKATNVVTVNPKTLHLATVRSSSSSTTMSKPNVIVVQKTQHPRFQNALGQAGTNIRAITTSSLPGAIDKELMGLVHKDSQGRHVLTAASPSITTTSTGRAGERRVIITTSGGSGEVKQPVSIIHRGRADSESKTSSLLAELIQAAGIMPSDGVVETAAQGTDPYDFDNTESLTQMGTTTIALATSATAPHHHSQQQISRLPLQWQTQHDVGDSSIEEETNGYGKGMEERRESQDSEISTEQVFTIEQAVSLLNKEGVNLADMDHTPTSSTSSTLPTTLASVSIIPSISQLLGQPKVSILSTSKTFVGETNRESAVTIQTPESTLGGVLVSPEEGLKEGQLDTQTGLFCQVKTAETYSNNSKSTHPSTTQALPVPLPLSLMTSVLIQAEPGASSSSSSLSLTHPPLDLLSSSLAEAQINLDSFNDDEDYDEDEDLEDDTDQGLDDAQTRLPVCSVSQAAGEPIINSRPGMAEVLREETAKDGTRILTVSNPASSQQESTVTHSNLLVTLPSQLSRPSSLPPSLAAPPSSSPASTYVTIQEVACPTLSKAPSTINLSVTSQGPFQSATSHKSNPQTNILPIAVSVDLSPPVSSLLQDQEEDQPKVRTENAAKMVSKLKESEVTDPLTLQQEAVVIHSDDMETGGSNNDSQSDGLISSDQYSLVRSSKRKRKHPSGLDESFQAAPGSWAREAASLLFKVARFKGSPRDKNEIPAAEWFTFPVDPLDAPDYYTVIQSPMDFSTMRKKLETGQYDSFEDFQLDMDLIRTNCYLYNSEGTKVRRDCDEVMVFYKSELAKFQEKHLNKVVTQNASPPKRPKIEDKIMQKPSS